APASTSRRHTSMALYAAMPPVTPRTIRRPESTDMGLGLFALAGGHRLFLGGGDLLAVLGEHATLDAFVGDLVGGDLLEPHAAGLARHRRDLGRHQRAQAVAEGIEVRVDLAGPPWRPGGEGGPLGAAGAQLL